MTYTNPGHFTLVACVLLLAPLAAVAQTGPSVPTRTIGKVDVESRDPFTAVYGLRELRDGLDEPTHRLLLDLAADW